MLLKLPIMLLNIAPNFYLLCPNYAPFAQLCPFMLHKFFHDLNSSTCCCGLILVAVFLSFVLLQRHLQVGGLFLVITRFLAREEGCGHFNTSIRDRAFFCIVSVLSSPAGSVWSSLQLLASWAKTSSWKSPSSDLLLHIQLHTFTESYLHFGIC